MNKPKHQLPCQVEYKKRRLLLSINIEQLEFILLATSLLPNTDSRKKRIVKILVNPLAAIVMELKETGLNNQTFKI